MAELARIVDSMGRAARASGVAIVTGDTKVVERGAADRVFINTAGIGVVPRGVNVSRNAGDAARRCGDRQRQSGRSWCRDFACPERASAERGSIERLPAVARSDRDVMFAACLDIHCLRDATRGGVATVLNEFAASSNVAIRLRRVGVAPERAGAWRVRDPRARSSLPGERGKAGGHRAGPGGRSSGDRDADTSGGPRFRDHRRSLRSTRGQRDSVHVDRRRPRGRHAGRRAIAAYLLARPRPCTSSASPTASSPSVPSTAYGARVKARDAGDRAFLGRADARSGSASTSARRRRRSKARRSTSSKWPGSRAAATAATMCRWPISSAAAGPGSRNLKLIAGNELKIRDMEVASCA